jgi:hypothetical protein
MKSAYNTTIGAVARMDSVMDLKSIGRKTLRVQVPLAPLFYLNSENKQNDEIQLFFTDS